MEGIFTKELFIYILLTVDLFVNVSDKPLYSVLAETQDESSKGIYRLVAITLELVQLLTIMCVVLIILLHLFEATDKVIQHGALQIYKDDTNCQSGSDPILDYELSQKLALKLVLKRYWWSLSIGIAYLVVTIIIRFVKFDTLDDSARSQIVSSRNDEDVHIESLRSNLKSWNSYEEFKSSREDVTLTSPEFIDQKGSNQTNISWISLIISIFHKLLSTIYYITTIIIIRTTPENMMKGILLSEPVLSISLT